MGKKVAIGTKPQMRRAQTPDDWVAGNTAPNHTKEEAAEEVKTRRFTIDIPTRLHARIKSQCALREKTMNEEIQALLEKHFPAE